tara:strand:+ start:62 stop:619 length:558 start_codon:yes stop_codon:yes gene_type:complete
MFGVDVLSSVPISHLLMAEVKTFNATSFDIEPSDPAKAGQYVRVKVVGANYHYKSPTKTVFEDGALKTIANDGDFLNMGTGRTAATIKDWALIKQSISDGYGLKFSSLLPADETGDGGTAKDCSTENRQAVAGDTATCGDCLSGYVEDETGVCVAVVTDVAKTETNWLLYSVIGVAAIGGIFYFK